jgi:vancomycin resistance protein YoaR
VTVGDVYVLDEETALSRLARNDFVLEYPVEPTLEVVEGAMAPVPGVDGVGIDSEQLVADLASAEVDAGPVEITATLAPIPPSISDSMAQDMATEINEMTEDGLAAAVGLRTDRLSPAQIRRFLSSHVENGEMTISIDVEGLQKELERLFPQERGDLEKPVLEVVDGEVRVVKEGTPPPVCCSTESVQELASQLLDGGAPIYHLGTRPSVDETMIAWANGSQVKEVVAEFTTHHACCENRVTNIQTMADAVRGYYMLPGETLSFNEYIGPRTREKGYLPAGAIRGGHMTDEVGGGVSQFVTTMFNAAFFGGLDLDEYQSHSVYFSRYPFGREATLSNPWPDLVLTNGTDHPVLIWPTYDDTSITVTLYSTQHIDVVELDQRVTYRRQCRHSEIDRQRTYADGRVVVDTIEANYRPGDGIDCNGKPIPRND